MKYKCRKCGAGFTTEHEQEIHEKHCKGISFTMDMIEKLANGEQLGTLGFTCEFCGGVQQLDSVQLGKELIFPVCNNCKKDLKELILAKRKDERKR